MTQQLITSILLFILACSNASLAFLVWRLIKHVERLEKKR